MLHIKNNLWEVFQSKKQGDAILIEPSKFINNFLVRSLDKFGVVKGPETIISEIMNNPEKNIVHDLSVKGGDIFRRPMFGNVEAIFKTTKQNLAEEKTVFATPAIAALFIEWGIQNEEDLDFELIADVEFDEISKAYADEKLKDFNPLSLERLLKLFSIFYGKKITKKEVKALSDLQIKLLEAEKSESLDTINTSEVSDIVKNVSSENGSNFSSNNIFNKILEEIESVEKLKEFGYNLKKEGSFTVFFHKEETFEKTKEAFNKLIEG